MVNYNNSAIYKLFCKNEEINDMYIGSTINFKRRKSQHKSKSIKEMPNDSSKCKLYKCIQKKVFYYENKDIILKKKKKNIMKIQISLKKSH